MNDDYDDEEEKDNVFHLSMDTLTQEEKRDIDIEGMQLADERLYMVLKPKGDFGVSVRCYDTTGSEEITAAHVILKGIMAVMEDDYEHVMNLGHQEIIKQLVDTEKATEYSISNNIIKVDFSKRKDN